MEVVAAHSTGTETPDRRIVGTIVNSVPSMLAYWDASLRCRFANAAYERWFGVRPSALIGTHIKDLLGPIYELNRPYIEGALRGESQRFEREIPDPRGGPPRYSQADYIPDIVDSTVRGFSVIVSDISSRKRLEDELREAKRIAEDSLARVRTLHGLLPVCAWCRKLRDPAGYWTDLEQFLSRHTDARPTHGICDSCARSVGADHESPVRG